MLHVVLLALPGKHEDLHHGIDREQLLYQRKALVRTVRLGGQAVLGYLGLEESDRLKPRAVSDEVIRAVEPYHAQLINRMRFGDMLIAGESLFIFETEPAGYVAYAANEALKAARVKLVDATLFGAFGRLYMSGSEAAIDEARSAALRAVEALEGRSLE